jgi:hypothetical protein
MVIGGGKDWKKDNRQPGEDPKAEAGVPKFTNAAYEKVVAQGNSWIVLGKDRPAGIESGNAKESHSHSIDMIVGRWGKNTDKVGPNFKSDAARIYISEKCNIDDPIYMDCKDFRAEGGTGNVKNKSAIGIKADSIRIVGREGIKLITVGGDYYNSKDGIIESIAGIDLCAGNRRGPNLQPLVRGNNLKACIDRMLEYIEQLQEFIYEHITYQTLWNETQGAWNTSTTTSLISVLMPWDKAATAAAGAVRASVHKGIASTLATKAQGIVNEKVNVSGTRNKYLKRNSEATYICSHYNNTN